MYIPRVLEIVFVNTDPKCMNEKMNVVSMAGSSEIQNSVIFPSHPEIILLYSTPIPTLVVDLNVHVVVLLHGF